MALKDETKEILAKLLNSIESTSDKLTTNVKNIEDISQDATRKTETSLLQIKKEKSEMIQRLNAERDEMVQRLEKKKEEMIEQYDGTIRQAEDKKNQLTKESGNELTAMRDNVMFLKSIKQSIEEEENTYEDALQKLDTVRGVRENVKHLPRTKTYEYSEYIPGQKNLVEKEKCALLNVRAPELQGQGQYTTLKYCFLIHMSRYKRFKSRKNLFLQSNI